MSISGIRIRRRKENITNSKLICPNINGYMCSVSFVWKGKNFYLQNVSDVMIMDNVIFQLEFLQADALQEIWGLGENSWIQCEKLLHHHRKILPIRKGRK